MTTNSSEWYYLTPSGKKKGPVTRDDVLKLHTTGYIGRNTLVWSPGMGEWTGFGETFEGAVPPSLPQAHASQPLPAMTSAQSTAHTRQPKADVPADGIDWQYFEGTLHQARSDTTEQASFFSFRGRVGRRTYWGY